MAISHGSNLAWDNGATPSTSVNVPAGLGTGGGELLVASVTFSGSGGATSCKVFDSTNGNWLVAIAPFYSSNSLQYVGLFFLPNTKAMASLDATAVIGAARANLAINVMIFNNADPISPLDKTASIDAVGSNPTTGTITPVADNCLIYSFLQPLAHTPTAGGGFTLGSTGGTTQFSDEWQIQTAKTPIAGSWTQAVSEGYGAGVASFLPATEIVQLTYGNAFGSTLDFGFTGGTTAGSLLLLAIELTSATDIASVVSVTDDAGNKYFDTGLRAQFSGTVALSIWYCFNSKAIASSGNFHITASESLNNLHAAAREIDSAAFINLALSGARSNISVVGSTLPGPKMIIPQKYSLFCFADVDGTMTGIQPPFHYDSFDLLDSLLNQQAGLYQPIYTLSSGTTGGMIVLAIAELGVPGPAPMTGFEWKVPA